MTEEIVRIVNPDVVHSFDPKAYATCPTVDWRARLAENTARADIRPEIIQNTACRARRPKELVCLTRHEEYPRLRWERVSTKEWQNYLRNAPRLGGVWRIPEGDPSEIVTAFRKILASNPKGKARKFLVVLENDTRQKTFFVCEAQDKGVASTEAKDAHPNLRPRICLGLNEVAFITDELVRIFQDDGERRQGPQRNNIAAHWGKQDDTRPEWNDLETPEVHQVNDWDQMELREFLIGCLPGEEPLPQGTERSLIAKVGGRIVAAKLPSGGIVVDETENGENGRWALKIF